MSRRRKLFVLVLLSVGLPLALLALDHGLRPALTADELQARLGTDTAPVILDVRTPAEFAAGHIPGARNVPLRELAAQPAELAAAKGDVVITCAHGPRASLARLFMTVGPEQRVSYLRGHMAEWLAAGRPLEGTDRAP